MIGGTVSTADGRTFIAPSLKFEGPLDLLLYMITQSEMNIYDIPIAEITDGFLEYLEQHQDMELATLTSFYRMAAELLNIKSRMLLPVEVEFDEEYLDPRAELVEQLLEYQKFRKYTELLSGESDGEFVIFRQPNDFALPFSDEELLDGITLENLLFTFRKLMNNIAPDKVFNVYEEVSLSEKIALIEELFETRDLITLEDVIVHLDSKLDIICAFMAILECCKLNIITIHQKSPDDTIFITAKKQEKPSLADVDRIDDEYDQMIEHGFETETDDYSTWEEDEEAVIGPLHKERNIIYGEQEEIPLDE